MLEQHTNHISLSTKGRPRCYAKCHCTRHVSANTGPHQLCPHCTRHVSANTSSGVTRRWGLLSHAQNAVRWLVLFERPIGAPHVVILLSLYSPHNHSWCLHHPITHCSLHCRPVLYPYLHSCCHWSRDTVHHHHHQMDPPQWECDIRNW